VIDVRSTRAAAAFAVVAVAVLAAPSPAQAQVVTGPFARLFGATPDRGGREWTGLDVRGSLGGEFSNVFFTDPARLEDLTPVPARRTNSTAGVANAGLVFVRHRTASELVVNGKSVYREYRDEASPYGAASLDGGARYRVDPGTRLTFESTASFAHQPFFYMLPQSLSASPDWLVDVAMTPNAVFMQRNDSVYGKTGIEYRPTKRTSVQGSVNGQRVVFEDASQRDYTTYGFDSLLRHRLTRDFGVHFGYGREDYRVERDDTQFRREFFDIGVDYARDISIARRTRFRFSTMTGMVREGEGPREFRFDGTASLMKDFNRTWHAELTGQRRTEFLPGFVEPMFSDTATLLFGGMLAPRLQWAFAGGGGRGRIGIEGDSTFRTATAATRVSVGLTRKIGTFVHYSYFYYDALPGSRIVLEQLGKTSRHSVVAGFNVWVPLYDHMKVPRDPE
jgi:hypothetical protein